MVLQHFVPPGQPPTYGTVVYQQTPFPRQVRIESASLCSSACSFCLPADEQVLTAEGLKPIGLIEVGDLVLTHDGTWQPVTALHKRFYEGALLTVRIPGFGEVRMTPDHPVLTMAGWKPLSQVTKHTRHHLAIAIPREEPSLQRDLALEQIPVTISANDSYIWCKSAKRRIKRFLPLDTASLFFFGLYIAEGNATKQKNRPHSGSVVFSLHKREEDLACQVQDMHRRLFGLEARQVIQRTDVQIVVSSGLLTSLFRSWFGHGAHNKRIPTWILALPNSLLESFLKGYLAGDGYWDKRQKCWRATTVSETLAHELLLVAYALGVRASIYKGKLYRRPIEGRIVNVRSQYQVRIAPFNGDTLRPPVIYKHQKRITSEPYAGMVYNLSVARNESFAAKLLTVHNCHGYGGFNPASPTAKKMTRPQGLLGMAQFEALLKEIADWPEPLLELVPTNFGEWFMAKDWFKQGQLIDQYLPTTRLAVVTTGQLLYHERLHQLASLQTLKHLNFSVNAYFAETYERIHHRSARALLQLPAIVKEIRELRPDVQVQVSMVYDSRAVSERERDLFVEFWRPRARVEVNYRSFADWPGVKLEHPPTMACRSVFDGLVVFSDLSVGTGCCFDADATPDLNIGRWPEQALLDIWRGDKLKRLMELHNSGHRNEIGICANCSFA